MFRVKWKGGEAIMTVYGTERVKDAYGHVEIQFLTYNKCHELWQWINAERVEPYHGE